MNAEITWDLVMSDDMTFAEGCFRLEGEPWQVVIAFKSGGVHSPGVRTNLRWNSGVTGMNIILNDDERINKEVLLQIMSSSLGVERWTEVKGPDSMALR